MYRFAQDTKRGDTLGRASAAHGSGDPGQWQGQRAGGGEESPDTGGATVPPATSAVFVDDANFARRPQAWPGARPARPGVASSVAAPGSLKIWAGPDCTGRSQVINGDVADLAAIGFDDAVASVRFN